MFTKLMEWLKGKKTFFAAAGLFLTAGAEAVGLISPELAGVLKPAFMAGGFIGLRMAK